LLQNGGVLIDVNWEGIEGSSAFFRRALYTFFFQDSNLVLGRLLQAARQLIDEDPSSRAMLGQRIQELSISCLPHSLGSKPSDRTVSYDASLSALEYVTHLHEGPQACFSHDHITQVLRQVAKTSETDSRDFTLHGDDQMNGSPPEGFDWSTIEILHRSNVEGHREPPPSRKSSRNTLSTSIDFSMSPKSDLGQKMQTRLSEMSTRQSRSPSVSPTISRSRVLQLSLSDASDDPLELSDCTSEESEEEQPTIVEIYQNGHNSAEPSSEGAPTSPRTKADIAFPEPNELSASQSHGSVHYRTVEDGTVCCDLL